MNSKKKPKIRWGGLISRCFLLTVTTALSSTLFVFNLTNKTFQVNLDAITGRNRTAIQVFIQVLSTLLGTMQIFVLTDLFIKITTQRMRRCPVSLNRLTWWNSLCQRSPDFTLPVWRFRIPLFLYIG